MSSNDQLLSKIGSAVVSSGKWGAIAALGFIVVINAFVVNPSGMSMRIQNNISGGHTWKTTEGLAFKVPFGSTVVSYHQEGTVAVTDNEELCDSATSCIMPRAVGFADTYVIKMEASFRYTLPKDHTQLEVMHDKVLNEGNLFGNTLSPFSADLLNYTASQFRAEDFMQGGQNQFKNRLLDQVTNGLLITKREKKLAEGIEQGDRADDRESGQTQVGKQYIYSVTIIEDETTGLPKRSPTAIAAYNINIVPSGINLVEYEPETRLKGFMTDKQDRVRARAKIVEDQQNEREQAITAQLKGDRQRIEKQNELLVQKDAAVIAGQQKVEVEKLSAEQAIVERQKIADLAVIDKKRELQVAEDNAGIQSANYDAAKFEAKAIKEVGFAQAAVDSAKLKAKKDNQVIVLAEYQNQQALATAEAMTKTNIQMPSMVMIGGNSDGSGNLDSLLNTKLMKDIVQGNAK